MKTEKTKLDQALSLLIRQRLRTRSLENTVRDLAMLLSENTRLIAERNEMCSRPLGFVHGVLGRVRDLIGSEVKLRLDLSADAMTCTVVTPDGVQPFSFACPDYDMNADLLASSMRSECERRRLIPKAQE